MKESIGIYTKHQGCFAALPLLMTHLVGGRFRFTWNHVEPAVLRHSERQCVQRMRVLLEKLAKVQVLWLDR